LHISEKDAAERISMLWREADVLPCYPVSDENVVNLLRAAEYAADVDVLDRYERLNYVGGVPRRNEVRRWRASDIVSLMAALEIRRQWRPDSTLHFSKFHPFEIRQWQAEAAGAETAFDDLDHHTVEDLLIAVVNADRVEVRQAIRIALVCKLKGVLQDE
jgi:hypothetical protein